MPYPPDWDEDTQRAFHAGVKIIAILAVIFFTLGYTVALATH